MVLSGAYRSRILIAETNQSSLKSHGSILLIRSSSYRPINDGDVTLQMKIRQHRLFLLGGLMVPSLDLFTYVFPVEHCPLRIHRQTYAANSCPYLFRGNSLKQL